MKTFCFKLYKSDKNEKLHKQINVAGLIYNHCIALHKKYYKIFGKYLHKFHLSKHLTKLKRLPKFKYMKNFDAQSAQDVVERIDRAYQLFFRNVKRKIRCSPPNFKKVKNYKSFTLKQSGWKLDENTHTIFIRGQKYRYFPHKKGWGNDLCNRPSKTSPSLEARLLTAQSAGEKPSGVCHKSFTLKQSGWKLDEENFSVTINGQKFKYFPSRKIRGKIKTVTIKRDSLGDIYIYFVTDAKIFEVETRTGERVGFDFGLKNFLTSSDGEIISSPLFFAKNSKLIAKACKNLSRKKKDSNGRRKAKISLARIYKKTANQRKDFHFKLARRLCLEYEKIFIEDLNLKSMQRLWGKKISDLAFGEFVRILRYQAEKFGVEVVEVDRFFASSQICSQCGAKNPEIKDLKIREWICPKCGAKHDRDINAAKNILKFGLGQRPVQEIE